MVKHFVPVKYGFNFKARTWVHSVTRHCEAASADKRADENYIHHLKMMTQRNGFCFPVFNCNKTGLSCKKRPQRTYIMQEEKKMQGHKSM